MPNWNAKAAGHTVEQSRPGGGRQPQRGSAPGSKGGGGADQGLKAAMDSARELMKAKRYDEAQKAFEAILDANPDAAPAYIGMGNLQAARGEYEEALEYYAGALHIKKDLPPALIMSGNVYMKQGLFDKALEKFKEALEVNPSLSNARLSISKIYCKLEKFDKAIDSLNDALEHNPQLSEARLALASIYQRTGKLDMALAELHKASSQDPESWQARLLLARLLAARGDYKQAVDACKKAVALKPDNAPIHYLMGRAYMGIREYELAMREYTLVGDLDPGMLIAKIGVARVQIEQGNLADAKKLLVAMSKGSRNLGVVHRLLAEIFMRDQAFEDAVAEYRAAILHGRKLTENYPELLTVGTSADNNARAKAEAYQQAFAKIDIDNSLTEEAERDDPAGGAGAGRPANPDQT